MVPPPSAVPTPACDSDHVVQFYEAPAHLHGAVAAFLDRAFAEGAAGLVIGTPETCDGVVDRLEASGADPAVLKSSGRLWFVDARETLAGLMGESKPDEERFRATIGGLLTTVQGEMGQGLYAFGEMVNLLLEDGNVGGVIRLEELWDGLAREREFTLLCAYAIDNFHTDGKGADFRRICQLHDRVLPAETLPRELENAPLGMRNALLQQQSLALRHEVAQGARARKEAEEANRAKSEFLSLMSHEFRTPLNAILGYQDLLEEEVAGPVTAEQRRYFDRIRRSTAELLELIDQILSLSQIDADPSETGEDAVDVATIVEEVRFLFRSAASRKGLELRIRKPPQPILVHADPKGVRGILRDLVSNAVKFTDAGHVEVESRTNGAGSLVLEVSDTGPGIPEQDLKRIFEPFVQGDPSPTRRHGGAGLGLPVSRKLAQAFGGDLTAASTVGVGSVFTLVLPSGQGRRPAPFAG